LAKPKITNRPWTDQENEILTKLYEAGASIPEIAEVLKSRTVDAIKNRAPKLGLVRPDPEIDLKLYEKYSKVYEL
jgi:hypothetical protein